MPRTASPTLRRAVLGLVAALAPAFLAAPGLAAAGPGGVAPSAAPAPASAPTASPAAPAAPAAPATRPVVDAVTCRSGCTAIDGAVPGSVVQASGQGMGDVHFVALLGRHGRGDDRIVLARPLSATATVFTVPAGARSGPVRAVTDRRVRSLVSRARLRIGRAGGPLRPGPLLQARADLRRAYAGTAPSVSFFVRSDAPLDVSVDVLRAADGTPVAHFDVPAVPARSVATVAWQATGPAPEGRYVWRVTPAGAAVPRSGGASPSAAAAQATRGPSFLLVRHAFPIAGPHTYGQGFGVARAGHTHQGQDVMADCGIPLVAVTGGTIKFAGQQSLAGNYLVLAGDDGNDYAYMHLRDRVALKKGAAVTIGQVLGAVGRTGDATACHLHFEVWPAPGWYTGGSPVDPLPFLKSWDD